MPQTATSIRTVRVIDWFITYLVGVGALALVPAVVLCVIMLAGSLTPWSSLPSVMSFSLAIGCLSVMVVGTVAALPCALFFWLAQRFTWRHVAIYVLCGAFTALPTMPLVMRLHPDFYTDPPDAQASPSTLERYLPVAPLFAGSGAFLGAIFWWRTGRHLR